MSAYSRRGFLSDVGRGMIAASVGAGLTADLGLGVLRADDESNGLSFGSLEPLVDFLQQTPPDDMIAGVVERIRNGVSRENLAAAAALANARAFGGEDYVGFHTLMALVPALNIEKANRGRFGHLPLLKVLYRNSARLHEAGATTASALRPVAGSELPSGADSAEFLRRQVREGRRDIAESTLVGLAAQSPQRALDDLLVTVEDGAEVHRVVLVHRAWEMTSLVGADHAHAMLRQSLRYCLKNEAYSSTSFANMRTLLPKLLDQYHLVGKPLGTRTFSDQELEDLVERMFQSTAEQSAEIAAGLLSDGFTPAAIAEAISLVANQLVLRDAGRTGKQVQPGKPEGSVHGDSIGVHACDSANAWRNIASHSDARHAMVATILGAYQVALDRVNRGGDFTGWKPRPSKEQMAKIATQGKCELLREIHDAVKSRDQEASCAAIARYLNCKHSPTNMWITFSLYAIAQDGALHIEKYFNTVWEEFHATRPAFRDRQLIALARVAASGFGQPAPGLTRAAELHGISLPKGAQS